MPQNLLVAHGGGPTAVINASLAGVVQQAQCSPEIDKVYAARNGIEGVLRGDFVELSMLTEAEIVRLARTPGSAIGSCRYKVAEEDYGRIVEKLDELSAGMFLYNGGNDSMDTCLTVSRITDRTRVIGIPKTIDNDLAGTDHSPGFPSAARYYAVAAAELLTDVEGLDIHVSILETMGRNAGWLAASTALAAHVSGAAPALVYLPEVAFDRERFLEQVESAWKARGERGFVVAVSEGLVDQNGEVVVAATHRAAVDSFGHAMPGNVSAHLASLITGELGIRARSEKPGLLGRVASAHVSPVDRREAFGAGVRAVQAAVDGITGKMITITRSSALPYESSFGMVDLADVANTERLLPESYYDAPSAQMTPAFTAYALPLLGDGLPSFFRRR